MFGIILSIILGIIFGIIFGTLLGGYKIMKRGLGEGSGRERDAGGVATVGTLTVVNTSS